MNKSLATNTFALAAALTGYLQDYSLLFIMGIFALSGALTNWLAVHMLFEKVPGLYGSGVIPAHFDDFRQGIRKLIMEQFFNDENIERFLSKGQPVDYLPDLAPVIRQIDLSPAYDTLVRTILESSFGGMLAMLGGEEALKPLKQRFIENLRNTVIDITQSDRFRESLHKQFEKPDVISALKTDIENIIDKRLDELTPQMVKTIIQDMIRRHLGWLVVWGGFFGALIGYISARLGLI
ncbi:MAG: DUF445 domain-containing protein [Gammaproteobacteria bacterium]|nr:DUF445 domain-containing protein [Gammaproteobacteria bacterium]